MVYPAESGLDFTDAIILLNDHDSREAARCGRHNSYDVETKQFVTFLHESACTNPAEGLLSYAEYLSQPTPDGIRLAASTYNKRMAAAKKRVRQLLDMQDAYLTTAQHAAVERELRRLKPKRINNVSVAEDKVLSMGEIRTLIDSTQDRTVALIVEFLSVTGCRISEALDILITDIKTPPGERCHVRVLGKRQKERWVYPSKDLIRRLRTHFKGSQWLFEHHNRQYSRIGVTQRIRSESQRILQKPITAHSLRHSFATYLINEKKLPEKKVADLLGHSSTAVTNMIYNHTRATPEDAHIPL